MNSILTYRDVKDVQLGDLDEKLVRANQYDNGIVCEYDKFDMIPYTGFEIIVRNSIAKKLAIINKQLRQKNLRLKVVYGYRAMSVQKKYFEKRKNELRTKNKSLNDDDLVSLTHNFVASPDVAGHCLAAAVDLTLIDDRNNEVDMGTAIANYTDPEIIKTYSDRLTDLQRKNRCLLLDAMMSQGFAPFYGEWWHFSYGDKEWAAYYKRTRAIYCTADTNPVVKDYSIAGGNNTSLLSADNWNGQEVNTRACEAILEYSNDADQAGIYYSDINQLVMAGGEFCGNATAATACMLGQNNSTFKVSGFGGAAHVCVRRKNARRSEVTARFDDILFSKTKGRIRGRNLDIVEFQGISHILLPGDLPRNYMDKARLIIAEADLSTASAIGAVWYVKLPGSRAKIDPVVWVRDIDTFYYESACGSGSMAAAIALGVTTIVQPTNESINVTIEKNTIITRSDVIDRVGFEPSNR